MVPTRRTLSAAAASSAAASANIAAAPTDPRNVSSHSLLCVWVYFEAGVDGRFLGGEQRGWWRVIFSPHWRQVIFASSSPPISLNPKPSPRATSTQHIIRSSLWASDVEKGDSNFRVSKSSSVAAAASRDESLLEGSGFESPNLSVLEVEKTQDASSLPRRYAQSIALRSPNTRAQRRETENQRRAARKRVKVAKESKKLCFFGKISRFSGISDPFRSLSRSFAALTMPIDLAHPMQS